MRLIKIITIITLLYTMSSARCTKVNIDIRDINIVDFVKLISKIEKKNILISNKINGKVNFISSKKLCKEELSTLLEYTLSSKGYTLIKSGGIYRIVKIADSSKYNLPVISSQNLGSYSQMITKVFNVKNENVDYIASKIRHFLSKSAKLVTSNLSNSIIITDYSSNIKTIRSVIDLIQRNKAKSIELVLLKNIKAKETVGELKNVAKTVFNEKVENEKVEILENKSINSIMIIGKEDNVKYIKKYLLMLDESGKKNEYIVDVTYLKNAEAKDISKMLKEIVDKKKYIDETQKPHISVDESSNFIVLMGPKNEIEYIKSIISKLDIDRQQVYVKARIVEVNMAKAKELGVKYGLEGGGVTSDGLLNFSGNIGSTGTAAIQAGTLGATLTSSLGDISKGLLLGVSINMLKNGGAGNVVSEPSLLCMNNKESSIYVGETRSIKSGTTTTTTGNIDNYKREDIGLKLSIKPRISNSKKVTLDISATLEDIGTTSTNDQPDTTKKEVKTTAILINGESIIIGGLVRNKHTKEVNKVPILGDIWGLGWLFKYEHEKVEKANLVIVLTPYIISKTSDLSTLRMELESLSILEYKVQKEIEKNLKIDKNNKDDGFIDESDEL